MATLHGVAGNETSAGDETVVAATVTDAFEAEVARVALEDAGIRAVVQADDAGGMHPQLTSVGGVRILVNARDLEEAQQILAGGGAW